MAENITPVQLSVNGFETREVMMIDYTFSQTTDREGQISGQHHRRFYHEGTGRYRMLLRTLPGKVGRRRRTLRATADRLPGAEERPR